MNDKYLTRCMAVLALMACFSVMDIRAAEAADGGPMRLATKLQGKVISGGAMWVGQGKKMEFTAEVQNARPGSVLVITGRRGNLFGKIAWMRVGKNGRASVTIHSGLVDVPEMQTQDLIEVWQGNQMVASGFMKQLR